MFVGEIGIPRREFLYEIEHWEARRILEGYYRRRADTWSATRWSTFHIMASFAGGDAMKSNGIFGPKDLLPLPWDTDDTDIEPTEPLTEEDIRGLQADIDRANAEGTPW